jgi:hypothetical protein
MKRFGQFLAVMLLAGVSARAEIRSMEMSIFGMD